MFGYLQLQRKSSETSLKSQPTSSSERYTALSNMSRKNSTMSLGGTPRMKRSVLHQNEKCPYCERIFGYKGEILQLVHYYLITHQLFHSI